MCGGFFAKILTSANVVEYITEREGNNMTNYERIKAMSVEEEVENGKMFDYEAPIKIIMLSHK